MVLPRLIFPDQVVCFQRVTFGKDARNRMDKIHKEKKKNQREGLGRAVCAVLNSGGGVISVGIENEHYNYNTMGLGLDIEDHLAKLLSPSGIEDFVEFTPRGREMLIYVRSWCSGSDRPRLCVMDTGIRVRSATTTNTLSAHSLQDLIEKKQEIENDRDPFDAKQFVLPGNYEICQRAHDFYNEDTVRINQQLDFGESVNVEFKSLDPDHPEQLKERLEESLPKYLSAFANTRGGFMFIGVNDETKTVEGCGHGMEACDLQKTVQVICDKARGRAHHTKTCPKDRQGWPLESNVIRVLVDDNCSEKLYIIAIKIPVFCCVVFENDPDCWQMDFGMVCRLKATDWLEKIQPPDSVGDGLVGKFQTLNLRNAPPLSRPVYAPQTVAQVQEKCFPVQEDEINIGGVFCELLEEYPSVSNFLNKITKNGCGTGILIASKSWAVDISQSRNSRSISEALLVCTGCYPTLFCLTEAGSPELWRYATATARHLKQILVNVGGHTGRVCVVPQLVDCHTGALIPRETGEEPPYPESYRLRRPGDVKMMLRSLAVVVLSFRSPLSDELGCEFLNLLTEEQFQILHDKDDIKHLFIHGMPGSGKTLVAMEKIKRIKNSLRCDASNILYLCENVGLRNFMRKQNICKCATRASFMKSVKYFLEVKHIIVDGGQDLQMTYGDWYERARVLVEKQGGFFWIFLDYFQQSNLLKTGLPALSHQRKAYLCQVLRNSRKVYSIMQTAIKRIRPVSTSDGQLPEHLQVMRRSMTSADVVRGKYEVRSVCKDDLLVEIVDLLRTLISSGLRSPKDIAVLFSRADSARREVQEVLEEEFSASTVERMNGNKVDSIVVDSIHRFSGLERDTVILVAPNVNKRQAKVAANMLLSAYSRARVQLYEFRVTGETVLDGMNNSV